MKAAYWILCYTLLPGHAQVKSTQSIDTAPKDSVVSDSTNPGKPVVRLTPAQKADAFGPPKQASHGGYKGDTSISEYPVGREPQQMPGPKSGFSFKERNESSAGFASKASRPSGSRNRPGTSGADADTSVAGPALESPPSSRPLREVDIFVDPLDLRDVSGVHESRFGRDLGRGVDPSLIADTPP